MQNELDSKACKIGSKNKRKRKLKEKPMIQKDKIQNKMKKKLRKKRNYFMKKK